MYKRLFNFLEIYKILYNLQFGFRADHSVNHALISLTESIKNFLDNKKLGRGIFLDLQKAFDTVNHQILLKKLHHSSSSFFNKLLHRRDTPLAWFTSYFSNRSQYVSVVATTPVIAILPVVYHKALSLVHFCF